jgi:hypothetical protein
VTARVEIFSAKIRVTPAAFSESVWVSSDWRTVDARAYPIRTCPAVDMPAVAARGSSVQADRERGLSPESVRCYCNRVQLLWSEVVHQVPSVYCPLLGAGVEPLVLAGEVEAPVLSEVAVADWLGRRAG